MQNELEGVEGTTFQNEAHEALRAAAGRQAYIAWRMTDVPTVYTTLMPFTCDVKELWEAETALRKQMAEDSKLLASPWRIIGPQPAILERGNMEARDLITFGFEIQQELGLPGVVKKGFENHPDVIAARAKARETEEYKLEIEHGNLMHSLRFNNPEPLTAEADAAARARVEEIDARLTEIRAGK